MRKLGLGKIKRPDLLIFPRKNATLIANIVKGIGGLSELPFVPETDPRMLRLLSRAILAVECENSLWRARAMPDFGAELTPQPVVGGKPGLKKTAVLPTVIVKQEDRKLLRVWQRKRRVPIHIWHVFYDLAFGIAFDKAEYLIRKGYIEATDQTFQAPGGATTQKTIYKIYYHHAYSLGTAEKEPKLLADFISDRNGHILPYVKFQGGRLRLTQEAISVLKMAARTKFQKC